jgi:phosphotriesterase-related protein
MTTVQTIRGPIDVQELGRTLSHEHLTAGGAGMERQPWIYNEAEGAAANVEALKLAKEAGINSLIDLTPMDLGRQAGLFQRVAEANTGVNIVCATGVYRWVPLYLRARDADSVAEHFLREIQDGIDGTSIRPGMIKLAWDLEYRDTVGREGFTTRDALQRTARGAARAAKAAGVPISCHTLASDELGTPLLDLFEDEGLDLRAVTIGHSNDSHDLDYLKGLAARGATVGFDRFFGAAPDEEKVRRSRLALEMVNAGYAEQVCLGHDASPYYRMGPAIPANPGCWLPVSQFEVPWLLENGATEDNVDAMQRRSIVATFEAAARMAATPAHAG